MEYINLNKSIESGKVIMVFVEGTILKPKHWYTLYNHNSYIPIGRSVEIINNWKNQGASIIYITSRKGKQAKEISNILIKHGFCQTSLVCRSEGEKYSDIIEEICPDILIEDDCRSIGGAWQMCITHVKPEIKDKILTIVVKEFKGIDELPKSVLDFDKT
ncbi:MAG: hypothetical protein RR585_09895 [Coprobacillus sp.]